MKPTLWIVAVFCAVASAPGFGAIYKWVDDNGNVRFSDQPPPGQTRERAETLDLPAQSKVPQRKPVRAADTATRRAMLETIRYQIKDSAIDRVIGKNYYATNTFGRSFETMGNGRVACTGEGRPMGAAFAESTLKRGFAGYQRAFHRLLRDNGYAAVGTESAVFAAQTLETPEISVAALITEAYFENCQGPGGASFNRTDLTIEWQVFDNLARRVLFTQETRGADDQFDQRPVPGGNLASFEQALLHAAEGLLADDGFLPAVRATGAGAADFNAGVETVSVDFEYGDDSQTFVDSSQRLEQGTVTVRTATGHGSGFFISRAGHVLTNEHVVSGSERVVIISGDQEVFARVLRSDPARDVALLQVDSAAAEEPLKISRRAPRIGESIYVVGTPLSEALSFSVTRGIVSGRRVRQGQSLIQTDAAINPGNSGGPVLDEFGNVVAMSVSGVFSQSGGSLNTNFLIPISDALAKIGL